MHIDFLSWEIEAFYLLIFPFRQYIPENNKRKEKKTICILATPSVQILTFLRFANLMTTPTATAGHTTYDIPEKENKGALINPIFKE